MAASSSTAPERDLVLTFHQWPLHLAAGDVGYHPHVSTAFFMPRDLWPHWWQHCCAFWETQLASLAQARLFALLQSICALAAAALVHFAVQVNPERRLGSGPTGADEIKRHKWFSRLDWQVGSWATLQPCSASCAVDEGRFVHCLQAALQHQAAIARCVLLIH